MKHQIYKKYKNFNIYQIKKKRDEYLSISYYISINKLKTFNEIIKLLIGSNHI